MDFKSFFLSHFKCGHTTNSKVKKQQRLNKKNFNSKADVEFVTFSYVQKIHTRRESWRLMKLYFSTNKTKIDLIHLNCLCFAKCSLFTQKQTRKCVFTRRTKQSMTFYLKRSTKNMCPDRIRFSTNPIQWQWSFISAKAKQIFILRKKIQFNL